MKLKIEVYKEVPELEKLWPTFEDQKKGPNEKEVQAFQVSTDNVNHMGLDDIRSYAWAKRRNISTQKKITKFVEAMWRFVFYAIFCIYGYNALFVPETAEWITDTKKHWDGWPLYENGIINSDAIQLYYQVELGSYLHQLMWTEVSRSDSTEMIIHHLTTILLIFLSWLTHFNRIGSSILLVHDVADIFLEAAKTFNYVSKAKDGSRKWAKIICDTLFGIFAIVFFVSRLIIYPRYLVYSLVIEAPDYFGGAWFGYYSYAVLLITLQLLHIFWFWLIGVMIFKLVTTGIDKDERSDSDDDDEEPTAKGKASTDKQKEKDSKKRK